MPITRSSPVCATFAPSRHYDGGAEDSRCCCPRAIENGYQALPYISQWRDESQSRNDVSRDTQMFFGRRTCERRGGMNERPRPSSSNLLTDSDRQVLPCIWDSGSQKRARKIYKSGFRLRTVYLLLSTELCLFNFIFSLHQSDSMNH